MGALKPPSADGTLIVVYKSPTGGLGQSERFEDVKGYEGEQRLIMVHFNDGSTIECHDTLFVRTWQRKDPE